MSLSVEHIIQVLGGFYSCDLAVFDAAKAPCRGADRVVIDALRELIAIKEAEPVAWLNPESTSEDYAFSFGPPSGSWNVPLIRKPE